MPLTIGSPFHDPQAVDKPGLRVPHVTRGVPRRLFKLSAVLGLDGLELADSGRIDLAVAAFRKSVDHAERAGEPRKVAWSLTMLAHSELVAGRLEEARNDITQAVALVAESRWTAYLPLVLAIQAELDLEEGNLDLAGERLTGAWSLATRLSDPCWLSVVGRGLGVLAARRDNPDEALLWLDGAYREPDHGVPLVSRWIDAATLDSICDLTTSWLAPPRRRGRRGRAHRPQRARRDAHLRGASPGLPGARLTARRSTGCG